MKTTVFIVIVLISSASFSQHTNFKGKVLDKATEEGIPFATIILSQGELQKHATACNIDGNFGIKDLKPGKYDLYTKVVGYEVKKDSIQVMPKDTLLTRNISLITKKEQTQSLWLLPLYDSHPPKKIKKVKEHY